MPAPMLLTETPVTLSNVTQRAMRIERLLLRARVPSPRWHAVLSFLLGWIVVPWVARAFSDDDDETRLVWLWLWPVRRWLAGRMGRAHARALSTVQVHSIRVQDEELMVATAPGALFSATSLGARLTGPATAPGRRVSVSLSSTRPVEVDAIMFCHSGGAFGGHYVLPLEPS